MEEARERGEVGLILSLFLPLVCQCAILLLFNTQPNLPPKLLLAYLLAHISNLSYVSSTRINFTPILAVSIVCQEIKPVLVPLCLFLTGHLNIHKFWVSLVLMWKSRDTRLQGLLVRDSPERQAYEVNSRYIS